MCDKCAAQSKAFELLMIDLVDREAKIAKFDEANLTCYENSLNMISEAVEKETLRKVVKLAADYLDGVYKIFGHDNKENHGHITDELMNGAKSA